MKTLASSLLDKYGKKDDSLNESQDVNPSSNIGGEVKRYLTQYTVQGNNRRAIGQSRPVLEAGVYKIRQDMQGTYFERVNITSDGLIRFKDERYEAILSEQKAFWGMKETFKKVGMNYQRGMLLKGPPGGGKSCLIKLMMEDVMTNGDIAFLGDHPRVITEALKEMKEVEPDRNVMVIIEEIDEVIQYNQRAMSELLDGQDKISGVLFVGTTNHIERIHPKFLREGRFDLKIEIGMPPREGRAAYLKEKIGLVEAETIIEEITDATDGFSFAQLREYVISVYCYKKDPKQVVQRIRNGSGLDEAEALSEEFSEELNDEDIRESVYHYYYAQDPVRSTKQFASNHNTDMAEFSGLANRLLKKYGANAITVAQEGLEEDDYSKQRNEIDRMIAKLDDEKKKSFKDKLEKADAAKGGAHRVKITAIHSMLRKETGMYEAETLRKHLPHGYKSISGVTWSNSQVDKYNAVQDQINAYIKKGQKPPEELLNGSHNLVVSFNQKDK